VSLTATLPYDLSRLREGSLTILLVVQCLLIFVAEPLAALNVRLTAITTGLLAVGFLVAALAASRSRTAAALILACAVVALIGTETRHTHPTTLTDLFGHGAALLALAALSSVVARAVFAPGEITYHRIRGAIVLYLNVALMFTAAYRLIAELAPDAFKNLSPADNEIAATGTMLYFSFTTLTSTGYGDILPIHPFARSLTNLESIIGQLFPATLLARIVTLHLEVYRRRDPQEKFQGKATCEPPGLE
jgi:voltage-gated potassium channel Kch